MAGEVWESTPVGRKTVGASFVVHYGDFSKKEMDAFGRSVLLLASVFGIGVDKITFQTFSVDSDRRFQIREWTQTRRDDPKVRTTAKGSLDVKAKVEDEKDGDRGY